MKNILILALLIFGTATINAQNQIHIHLDKAFYTSGEVMWYKIYYPKALQGKTFSVRVAMTDNMGGIQDSWVLETEENGQSDGYYNIPYNWKSGNYAFHLSGFDTNTKQVVSIGHITVPVFNDLDPLEVVTSSTNTNGTQPSSNLKIALNQSSYGPGGAVSASVSGGPRSNQSNQTLSISVIDANLCDTYGSNIKSIAWHGSANLANQFFVSGKVVDENGNGIPDMVLGAYSPIEDKINYLKTDTNGDFVLRSAGFKGSRSIQFVPVEGNPFFKVQLRSKIAGIDLGTPAVSESVQKYIDLSRDRKKISQYFGQNIDRVAHEAITFKPIKVKPENSYDVSDYQAFENVAEFFIEINSPLGFRLDKDTTLLARISKPVEYYTIRGQKDADPIFIIDGKMTKDAHYVGTTRLETMKSSELYYDPLTVNQKYKTLGSGGVVKLYTKNNDFFLTPEEERHIFNVNGMLPKGNPKPRTELDGDKPWFSPQVYWNANLTTNNQGQANISFAQSDDVSTFVIRVVGIKEDGSLSVGEERFEVK